MITWSQKIFEILIGVIMLVLGMLTPALLTRGELMNSSALLFCGGVIFGYIFGRVFEFAQTRKVLLATEKLLDELDKQV